MNSTYKSAPTGGMIYVAELARRGSRKIVYSAMPETHGADRLVSWRQVPLAIRREARAYLLGAAPAYRTIFQVLGRRGWFYGVESIEQRDPRQSMVGPFHSARAAADASESALADLPLKPSDRTFL